MNQFIANSLEVSNAVIVELMVEIHQMLYVVIC